MGYDPTGRNGSASNNDGPSSKTTSEMMHQGQNMDVYRQNFPASSYAVDKTPATVKASTQTASRPPNGQIIAKATGATAKPKGNVKDYVDMITHAAFGGVDPTAAISGKVAPVPHTYTGPPRNGTVQQSGNDDKSVQDALDRGISLEQIAAGAIGGAGTAVIARSIIDAMNNKLRQTDAAGTTQSQTVPAVTPRATPTKQGDILTRNGMVQGKPTSNPDIDANFYEVFGLPMPNRGEPRLTTSNGVTRETSVPSGRFVTGNPGPNDTTKRLGDMDSPTYRDNFGLSDIHNRAQEIVSRMNEYGMSNPTDIGKFMDESAEPAVARAVRSALGSAF